jgi:WD40 repeat protein
MKIPNYQQFFALVLFFSVCLSANAQGIQTEFGKNRIQYTKFYWSEYESPNFMIYFHQTGRELGQFTALTAEQELQGIQTLLEYSLNARIDILVYTDLNMLKQSNIGNDEVFRNTGGTTKIVDSKMFVYFDGNHEHLRKSIRQGIAQVLVQQMLFGDDIQEIMQNAVLLHLPQWFTDGLIDYTAEDWSVQTDNEMRTYFANEKPTSFEQMLATNPRLAGRSMWYFIAQNYGKSTVSNMLYLTRINRSVESGFLYVLGNTYAQVSESWADYYFSRYGRDITEHPALDATVAANGIQNFKIKRKYGVVNATKMHPNGKQILYTTNQQGKARVWLASADGKTKKQVWCKGFRNNLQATDNGYPLVAWSRTGKTFLVVYEYRNQIFYESHDALTNKVLEKEFFPNTLQRILSIDFMGNDGEITLSGMQDGYSDIFLYRFNGGRLANLTRDHYDDLNAAYFGYKGQKGILFASNRPEPEVKLPKSDSLMTVKQNLDIFYIDAAEAPFKVWRATNTPSISETQPMALDTARYIFKSDANGIENQFSGAFQKIKTSEKRIAHFKNKIKTDVTNDSIFKKLDRSKVDSIQIVPVYEMRGVNFPLSDLPQSINDYHIVQNQSVELVQTANGSQLRIRKIDAQKSVQPANTFYRKVLNAPPSKKKETVQNELREVGSTTPQSSTPEKPAKDTSKIDIDNYTFQTEFDEPKTATKTEPSATSNPDGSFTIVKPQFTSAPPETAKNDEPIKFNSSKIYPYTLRFKTDELRTQLFDNTMLFGGIDQYQGGGFAPQPIGMLMTAGARDQLENHRIIAGIRPSLIPFFSGLEAFVTYQDRENQLDKYSSIYYRNRPQGFFITDPKNPLDTLAQGNLRETTTLAQYEVRYPLDVFTSLRGKVYGRLDNYSVLADDRTNLSIPSDYKQYVGVRGEYVFDSSSDIMINIKHGSRAKFFVEAMKSAVVDLNFDNPKFDFENGLTFDKPPRFDFRNGFTAIVGFDARHYFPLFDGKTIFAVRGAGAASFGSEKMQYFLGGTDGDFFAPLSSGGAGYNTNIPSECSDCAFQTQATNLRGFIPNIRNGSSYLVSNLELRLPIFWYLYSQAPPSNFTRSFQMVGFFDTGSAWVGLTPFDKNNPINTKTVGDLNPNSVQATINYYRNPIVASYGMGLRATIFGYFMRLDYGIGLETSIEQRPLFHFSIGTDF